MKKEKKERKEEENYYLVPGRFEEISILQCNTD